MGIAANLGIATATSLTDLCQYIIATYGYNDLQFRRLCSELATVETFRSRYTQRSIVYIAYSDHLVVKPSENPLNLATTFGFSDPDQTGSGRKTQCRLYYVALNEK